MTESPFYNEKLLLAAVARGDRKAFNQLYAAHIDNVYHYIYLFTKSREETEELLQEVFVKIWEKRERLTEIESFKGYLFRAAKNTLISNIRHMKVRHRVLSEIRRSKDSSQHITEDDVAYKEYYRVVQKAVEMLPPKRKLIFQLNTESGLSHDEIAEKLQITKSVVKNQLYKAYDFVRQHLAQHGAGPVTLIILIGAVFDNWC